MNRLLLATHNRHKMEEIRALLGDVDVQLATLDEFPHVGDIDEDADTLEGNALKKAREVFRLTGIPSLADDTGLEVEFLNGSPGVYSARYAGPNATYSDNCKKLLQAMDGVPPKDRGARFRAVLAFVAPDNVERITEGICAGTIIELPSGTNGFGYDPLFVPEGHSKTFAEMSDDGKNSLSHRARGIHKMIPLLREYFA